jgi:hypothetical protein
MGLSIPGWAAATVGAVAAGAAVAGVGALNLQSADADKAAKRTAKMQAAAVQPLPPAGSRASSENDGGRPKPSDPPVPLDLYSGVVTR